MKLKRMNKAGHRLSLLAILAATSVLAAKALARFSRSRGAQGPEMATLVGENDPLAGNNSGAVRPAVIGI